MMVEPEPGIVDASGREWIARVGLGTPDVRGCVAELRARGVIFEEMPAVHTEERGALTHAQPASPTFELVRDARAD